MMDAVFEVFNFRSWRKRTFEKTIEIFPLRGVRDPMVNLQIIPDKTVHSGRAIESILYTFHSMHEGFMERFWNEGFCIVLKSKDFASFRIVYENQRITFHLSVPSSFVSTIKHTVHNVWPKATLREVPASYLDRLDPAITTAAYLELKDHYFKSTLVDRTRLEPIPSLMAAGRNIMEDDLAILDIAYVPISDQSWHQRARTARNKYRKGIEPKKLPSKWTDLLFMAGDFLVDGIIEKLFGLLDSMFGAEKEKEQVDETRAGREMRPSTEQKFTHSGFEVVIRIASQSKNQARAEKNLTSIGTAYKDLSADNEFEIKKVPKDGKLIKPTTRFVQKLMEERLPSIILNSNVLSVPEASQTLQLPSAPIQEEYPEIEQTTYREQRLPEAISDGFLPGSIPLGETTGIDPLAVHIPGGMSKSQKDDRCTPTVVEGGQGSGKTQMIINQGVYWFGSHLPHDEWVNKGRTVFLYDVTGGQTIKEFLESCPPDRRHRCLVIDYGMADRRPALNFAVPGMDPEDASMLAAQTIQFIELVTQQEMGPQTHRWLTVHSLAAFEADQTNGPLEIVQSMINDQFRVEKIIPHLKSRNIIREMAIFAAMEPEQRANIVAPILNRFYKLTLENPRLWEIVAQRPIVDEKGEPVVQYRQFMDATDGPYAILVNVPPADDRGRVIDEKVQQAIMLAEASKLWAATLTRNPMDPNLKEYMVAYDEPHQFMKGTPFFKRMFREIRKYRGRVILAFHEWKAIKDQELAAAILGSDPNFHILKGADTNFEKLAAYLSPFTLEEYMAMPKYYAINRIKAEASSHVFMCKLNKPASEVIPVYPLGDFWRKSAESTSRPVEMVREDIFDREGNTFDPECLQENPGEAAEGEDLDCLKD